MKLMSAAEKAKKDLSPYGVTQCPINIECLMEDRDFSVNLVSQRLRAYAHPIRELTPLRCLV